MSAIDRRFARHTSCPMSTDFQYRIHRSEFSSRLCTASALTVAETGSYLPLESDTLSPRARCTSNPEPRLKSALNLGPAAFRSIAWAAYGSLYLPSPGHSSLEVEQVLLKLIERLVWMVCGSECDLSPSQEKKASLYSIPSPDSARQVWRCDREWHCRK